MNKNRSLLALITLCAVAAVLIGFALAGILATATAGFAVADEISASGDETVTFPGGPSADPPAGAPSPAGGAQRVFVGLVTDDHCGARHVPVSPQGSAECTRMCIRNGSKYVLVNGEQSYLLQGGSDELDAVAGQRANIVGSLAGGVILVSSVSLLP